MIRTTSKHNNVRRYETTRRRFFEGRVGNQVEDAIAKEFPELCSRYESNRLFLSLKRLDVRGIKIVDTGSMEPFPKDYEGDSFKCLVGQAVVDIELTGSENTHLFSYSAEKEIQSLSIQCKAIILPPIGWGRTQEFQAKLNSCDTSFTEQFQYGDITLCDSYYLKRMGEEYPASLVKPVLSDDDILFLSYPKIDLFNMSTRRCRVFLGVSRKDVVSIDDWFYKTLNKYGGAYGSEYYTGFGSDDDVWLESVSRKRNALNRRIRSLESKKRSLVVPCILKENRRRRCEDAMDGLSDAVDVIEGKDIFNARAFKFEIRSTNGMMQNGKFVGKIQASLTMRYEGAECSISLTDNKAEMTIQEMPDVTTQIYSAVVSLPTSRRDVTIEREGNGYIISIGADCNVTCRETNMDGRDLCYCKFTFHITNKRTVGKLSAWILEGVDDSVKKRGGSRRGRGGSLAGMLDLDMFPDGTTYDDIEYALDSGDFSMLF